MQRLVLLGLLGLLLAPAALPAQDHQRVFVAGGPDEGRDAPDFTLPWANKDTVGTDAEAYALWRDRGKVVVLAFLPRDFTRTDSVELATFRDRYDDIFGPDAVVLAVSADPLEIRRRFAVRLNVAFRLLSDPDQAVAAKYGSKDNGGIDRRTVYVIGPDGRVRWRDLRFQAADSKAYEALRRAVRAAGRG